MSFEPTLASFLVASVGLAVVAWGATVSARAAVRGPNWAAGFLVRSRRAWVGVGLAGLAVALIDPPWVGLTISYLALVSWWLSGRVGRGLTEALELGPYTPPPPVRRLATIHRTVLGLATSAAASAALGLLVSRSRGDLTVLAMVMAALLGALAWHLWREGTRLVLEWGRGLDRD